MDRITIEWVDDEMFEVLFDGEVIGTYDHDEHGWSGMRAVEVLVVELNKRLGCKEVDDGTA